MIDWKAEHDHERALRREWSKRAQRAERLLDQARHYIESAERGDDREVRLNSTRLLADIRLERED